MRTQGVARTTDKKLSAVKGKGPEEVDTIVSLLRKSTATDAEVMTISVGKYEDSTAAADDAFKMTSPRTESSRPGSSHGRRRRRKSKPKPTTFEEQGVELENVHLQRLRELAEERDRQR